MEDVEQKVGALLPCPFCGSEASDAGMSKYSRPLEDSWWEDGTPVERAYFVNCLKCFATTQGLVGGQQTQEKAIAAWNRRTPSAKLAEVERELLDARNQQAAVDRGFMEEFTKREVAEESLELAMRALGLLAYIGGLPRELRWTPEFTRYVDDQVDELCPPPLTPSAAIERAGE